MRFRTAGRNWEPRPWQLAPSLIVLGQQISVVHPAGRPGDGTVASKAHDEASPTSDHRPYPYTGPGIVRAIDVGEAKNNDPMVASLVASRDPRIAYIIYEGRAIRSYPRPGEPAWTWHPYRGPAPHSHHWHLSILRTSTADNDTRPWAIMEDDMPTPEEVAAAVWQYPARSGTSGGNPIDVRFQLDRIYRNVDELTIAHRAGTLGTTAMAEIDDDDLQAIADAVNDELARRARD